jgi:hypothetical protein
MKMLIVSSAVLLILVTGCSQGSDIEVTTPATSIRLSAPGPNPELNQPTEGGRVAGLVDGLWHGIISPVTLVGSFFNPEGWQMYEVHNNGPEYNLGFLFGVALIFLILGVLGGRGRWR